MPTPAGGYGRGKRGTHTETDHQGYAGAPNMPAKDLETQADFNPSGKRGVHESDLSGNTTKEPNELKRQMHEGGWADPKADADLTIDSARGHDPRRSHS